MHTSSPVPILGSQAWPLGPRFRQTVFSSPEFVVGKDKIQEKATVSETRRDCRKTPAAPAAPHCALLVAEKPVEQGVDQREQQTKALNPNINLHSAADSSRWWRGGGEEHWDAHVW